MVNFKQIDEARKILNLGEYASLEEVNKSFRKLALRYHPDKCKGKKKKECEEKFKQIAHAKDLLSVYCERYRYSFKEKDVKRSSYDKEFYRHLQKFYDGWWEEI